MADLKKQVQSMVDCTAETEVLKITSNEVQKAAVRMKPGKLDVSQGHTSDIFLHAPSILFEKLAAVFRSFLVHGTITKSALA